MLRSQYRLLFSICGRILSALLLFLVTSTVLQAQSVTPFGMCAKSDPSGGLSSAWFGYDSLSSISVFVPAGENNFFLESPHLRSQTANFDPGVHPYAFSTTFRPAEGLHWILNGAFGVVVPGQGLPVCPAAIGPALFAPVGLASTQTVRLTVAGNATGTCSATLGFGDAGGNPVGGSKSVILVAGQSDFLDLAGSALPAGSAHREVQPLVSIDPSSGPLACQPNVEIFATASAVTAVSVSSQIPAIQPVFPMQGLASGQTLRVAVSAYPGSSCQVTLGFAASDGTAVGPTSTANLTSGQAAFLDLPSALVPSLVGWVGRRAQIRPVVTVAGGACLASSDIFDTLTGLTRLVVNPSPLP